MIKTFEISMKEFQAHDIGKIMEGFKTFAQFMGEAVLDLGMCPGVRDEVARISARVAEIANPINFMRVAGKNVVLHGF